MTFDPFVLGVIGVLFLIGLLAAIPKLRGLKEDYRIPFVRRKK